MKHKMNESEQSTQHQVRLSMKNVKVPVEGMTERDDITQQFVLFSTAQNDVQLLYTPCPCPCPRPLYSVPKLLARKQQLYKWSHFMGNWYS